MSSSLRPSASLELVQAPSIMTAAVSVPQKNFLDIQANASSLFIGGHRGMGANVIRGGALAPAWRENTLRSFQAAAASGAAFVEFDVQVTADGVPVVWHDNVVEYGDPAAPTQCAVADLTAAEFQALGALSASGKCQQLSVVRRFKHAAAATAPASAEGLAAAVGGDAAAPQRRRWCCEVDDAFPTLEQLFNALPEHLAFNIEVKMATPDDLAATPAAEIARMVGPILDVVGRCNDGPGGPRRHVVFSSFDPDVCRALAARQAAHPVMFLSTGGREWHADARRTSLAAAVQEAAAAALSGVVVDSGALAASPQAAGLARAAGLRLLTYGLENDSAEWVLRQQALGVSGVIVDDLEGLMRTLRSSSSSSAASSAAGSAAASAASSDTAGAVAAAPAAAGSGASSGAGEASAAAAAVVGGLVGQVASAASVAAAAALQPVPAAPAQPMRPAVVAS